ncbi:SulP family inorganic anion transporter [Nannocystis radixulma]|uniref:SulP family inorganic anion transporter n=1 Tax=Nannocystis radixulma TaxID=2995305 RepID=A0ABT5B8I1_9BACT|nr:SulP family inorganic anion transporter [Nannocystis radixulma]MDC0670430.1 SulP family inorganic anion transporter [Nannocystis radixulma]
MSNRNVPADGLAGLRQNLQSDLVAGFLVFLIALPLSLGISMASGFPPVAGIFTAIIGGLIVTLFMGARVTIKGPAAGLIVIALGCIEELSRGVTPVLGYQYALAVIVAAGVAQIIFGLIRAGVLADFFPSAAVHGMLAAIGIIIASKQLHIMVGIDPTAKTPVGQILELPKRFVDNNPEIALIGLLSLAILVIMPRLRHPLVRKIPAPLVVLLLSIPLGIYFDLDHAHNYRFAGHEYHLEPTMLVNRLDNLLGMITFPDFSMLASWTSIKWIIAFALVGSIESVASAKAVDTLDPYKRKSDFNRDLLAVGVGNTAAGLIGGLPMISEIVRSSANINNGAKTRWANFFHGAFLLGFVVLAPGLIHMIPKAALAAMLVFTGFRLAHPREFIHTAQVGKDQLLVFLVTIGVTVGEDLLLGIFAGIFTKLLLHIIRGAPISALFKPDLEIREEGTNTTRIVARKAAIFSNYIGLKRVIDRVPAPRHIVVDLQNTRLVDHTVMERLHELARDLEHEGRELTVVGLEGHKPVSGNTLAARTRPA